jgi:Protein of unknown function (DUF3298)
MRTAGHGPRVVAVIGFALVSLIAVAACGSAALTPETIIITPSPGPVTPLPPGVTPEPTAAPPTITTFLVDTTALDSRWKVTFKKPVIGGIPDAAATAMNNAITDKVNAFIKVFTDSGLPTVATGDGPSTLEGDYSIALNTAATISLRFTILTSVTGAAHPAGQPGSITFVVSSGAVANLPDLFSDQAKALATVTSECKAALTKLLAGDLTWDGKASSFDFFSKAWAITPTGLELTFPQGDLASQAAGMPSANVPWSKLKSVIKDSGPAGAFAK